MVEESDKIPCLGCNKLFKGERGLSQHKQKATSENCKDDLASNLSTDLASHLSNTASIESGDISDPIMDAYAKFFGAAEPNSILKTIDNQNDIRDAYDDLTSSAKIRPEPKPEPTQICPNLKSKSINQSSDEFLVETLLDRIDSLEAVVQMQQETIRSLLNSGGKAPAQTKTIPNAKKIEPIIQHASPNPITKNNPATSVRSKTSTKSTPPESTPNPPKEAKKPPAPPAPINRKRVEIFGDSMIGGVNPRFMCAKNNYKVHSYGGATTQDMVDLLRVGMRRNPNSVIIHSGTNDVTMSPKIDTLAHHNRYRHRNITNGCAK